MSAQNEATLATDRTAVQYRGTRRRLIGLIQLQLCKQTTKIEAHGPIDDDAQRAFGVMFTNQGNGAVEIWIGHAGHGDQQLIAERILMIHCSSITELGSDAATDLGSVPGSDPDTSWYLRWTECWYD